MDEQQQSYLRKSNIPFTMVANAIIFDNRISSKAKFYYVYLSSKPDGWKFHTNCIIKEIKEGRDAFYSGLKELIQFGYLERMQIKEGGKFKHTDFVLKIPSYTENTDTEVTDTGNTDYNNKDINKNDKSNKDKDTASGLSQNENPTVKDYLTTQKPKKEDDFEQAWLFWKDLCKNKGSQTGEKKPAKIQYEKVLKKVKQDDIMRVLKAFNDYIQIAFENNKNFERWIKSANWDNIDEAVADYKQQESNRKKELIKDGKPLPLPQKTTMEAEKEVIDTNALIELRNAKYNALTQDRQKASDEIRDHLLTYFVELHHEWINSSLWYQQTLVNGEVDLHIGIFSEKTRKVIELNDEKIRDKLRLIKGNIIKEIKIKVIK